jgi:anti-anti-sigma factor
MDASIHSYITDLSHVFALHGEYDIGNVQELEAALRAAESTKERIVIDLRHTSYMDSSVLGVLIRCRRDWGSRLHVVVDPDSMASRLFDVTGLGEHFDLRETISQPSPYEPRRAANG